MTPRDGFLRFTRSNAQSAFSRPRSTATVTGRDLAPIFGFEASTVRVTKPARTCAGLMRLHRAVRDRPPSCPGIWPNRAYLAVPTHGTR